MLGDSLGLVSWKVVIDDQSRKLIPSQLGDSSMATLSGVNVPDSVLAHNNQWISESIFLDILPEQSDLV